MEIILDTNFLVYCAKNKLDYFEEIYNLINEKYELVTLSNVIKELEKLKEKAKKYKDKISADLALQLIEKNKIRKINFKEGNTDELIIKLSKKSKKNIVATLDREMRKILKRVILINKKNRLILTR